MKTLSSTFDHLLDLDLPLGPDAPNVVLDRGP